MNWKIFLSITAILLSVQNLFALDDDAIHEKLNAIVEQGQFGNGEGEVLELLVDDDDCSYKKESSPAAVLKLVEKDILPKLKDGKLKKALTTSLKDKRVVTAYSRNYDAKTSKKASCNKNSYRLMTEAGTFFRIENTNKAKSSTYTVSVATLLRDSKNCKYRTLENLDEVMKNLRGPQKELLDEAPTAKQLEELVKAKAFTTAYARVLDDVKGDVTYCNRYYYRFVTTAGYVLALDYDTGD